MEDRILLIGGGGHCKSCIDVIEQGGRFNIAGIIDKKENIGKPVSGYQVIGCDDDISKLIDIHKNAMITVGQIKTPDIRIKLFNRIKESGGILPVIISPYAHISKNAHIEEGTIILHNAVINSGAVIGKNCIINTSAVIEHDVVIGDYSHISTGCVINGECRIGGSNFIGSNSVVCHNINICDSVVIGAGSVVCKNINDYGIYTGNPVKRIGNI